MNNPLISSFKKYFKPILDIDIDEWADTYRELPRGSSEPGKWRTSRTPYLRQIMKDLSPNSPVQKVVVIKGTQLGFTEVANNIIGFYMHIEPRSIGMWLPTEALAERHAKKKLWKMIETTPVLKELVYPRSRGAGDNSTITQILFPGGACSIYGSNSSASYRSDSISVAIKDDIDGFVNDVEGEGSPIELIDNRTDSFANRKIYENSTPTIKGMSHIETEFEESTQSLYYMPCPECKKKVVFELEYFKFDYSSDYKLKSEVKFCCMHCGSLISENKKTWMMERGEYIDSKKHIVKGYRVNSFYSPLGWTSWRRIITEYLKALKKLKEENDDKLMKRFVNTRLAKTYTPMVKKTEVNELKLLKIDIEEGIVPENSWKLVASFDVQKDHFWYEVRALLFGNSFHVLRYGRCEDWVDVEEIIRASYFDQNGNAFGFSAVAIDSGYRTDEVYQFCLENSDICLPVKGNTNMDIRYRISRIEKETYDIEICTLNPDFFKDILDTKIKRTIKLIKENKLEDKNIFSVHKNSDDIFFEQYTSEYKRSTKDKKGRTKTEWIKYKNNNHLWDCGVYNTFLSEFLGHRFAKRKLQKKIINKAKKHKNKKASSHLDNY